MKKELSNPKTRSNSSLPKTIVILGPTAAGKTQLAVELARRLNYEIISADSMQVYRGMDIGTAKPDLKERRGIAQHLIDVRNPDEEWTVSDFVKEANRISAEIFSRGKAPIIAGGTGLYLWALFEGFSFPITPADKNLRARLAKEPLAALRSRLAAVDPKAAEKIHPNDKKRTIRALEVYELTGKPISELQRREPQIESPVPSERKAGINSVLIGINVPREELYRQIDARVDKMLESGLIDEVKGLLAKGYSKELPSFQALGYKEVCEYLEGKWPKEQLVEELKKRTRRFSRRQLTWFKRFKKVAWFSSPVDTQKVLDYINSI